MKEYYYYIFIDSFSLTKELRKKIIHKFWTLLYLLVLFALTKLDLSLKVLVKISQSLQGSKSWEVLAFFYHALVMIIAVVSMIMMITMMMMIIIIIVIIITGSRCWINLRARFGLTRERELDSLMFSWAPTNKKPLFCCYSQNTPSWIPHKQQSSRIFQRDIRAKEKEREFKINLWVNLLARPKAKKKQK